VQEKAIVRQLIEREFIIIIIFCLFLAGGTTSNGPIHPGHRRQQYTLAELPFACEFCPARYKTKPGLQYHLAKHKDANGEIRPSSSTPDTVGSASPTSAMKQKYMDPHQQQQQPPPPPPHPMYPNQPMPGPPMHHGNPGGPPPPPGMQMPPYPMSHQQQVPYGMPPQQHHHPMPPSASMPLTVAALSGSAPPPGVPYYPQQQHQMAHQQHMMMMQQQQQQHPQQHPPPPHPQQYQQQYKPPAPVNEPPTSVITGLQCDFCGGDEQENKTTKLPEQMITCKVVKYFCSSIS